MKPLTKQQLAQIYEKAYQTLAYPGQAFNSETYGVFHKYACNAIQDVIKKRFSNRSYDAREAARQQAIELFASYFKPVGRAKGDAWFGNATYSKQNYERRLLALMFMVEICK